MWTNKVLLMCCNTKCSLLHYIRNYDGEIGWNAARFLLFLSNCSVSCGRGNLRQDTCAVCLLRLNFSRIIDVRSHHITLGIEGRVCVMRLEAQPKGATGLSQLTVHEQWWILRWVAQPKGATGLSVYLQVCTVRF